MATLEKDRINCFITTVERLLGVIFEKKIEEKHIVLHAYGLDLSLVIYLPDAGARLPQALTRTIHIDYDQLLADFDKLCARLASLHGNGQVIYARKTVAARIDKRVTVSFLEEHHLQSATPGKYRYGLFHDGELVSIAVFSGGRRMRDQREGYRSFELIRFCHKSNFRVVGGLSKLLKAFIVDFQPADIMTYVDRDWSQDSNLSALGFKKVGTLAPQCYQVMNGRRQHISDPKYIETVSRNPSEGYFICNSGSTKLLLIL